MERIVLLLIAIVSIHKAHGNFGVIERCPTGWVEIPGKEKCMKVYDDAKTWEGAKDTCEMQGGGLLDVMDKAQEDFTQKHLKSTGYWISTTMKRKRQLVHFVNNKQVAGGYSNWHEGEPNGRGDQCVELRGAPNYGWNDQTCGHYFPYICQKPKSGACSGGWKDMLNSKMCLRVFTEEKAWDAAQESCIKHGGGLLHLTSKPQEDALIAILTGDHYWIGAKMVNKRSAINTIDGKDQIGGYVNWRKNEPNGLEDECVELLGPPYYGMNDHWCGQKSRYICQQPIEDVYAKSAECSKGYHFIGNKCLAVNKRKYSWKRARAECQKDGGDLADINDASMTEHVKTLSNGRYNMWTGVRYSSNRNTFVFLNGQQANETYENWRGDRPSGSKPCVEVAGKHGQWRAQRCSKRNQFVCQAPSTQELSKQGKCDEGWTQVDITCVKQIDEVTTWDKAREICQKQTEKGDLLEIYGTGFSGIMQRLIGDKKRVWLGTKSNILYGKMNYNWNSKTWMTWNNFFGSAHTVKEPTDNPKAKCVEMGKNGIWSAISCDSQRVVFCQKTPKFKQMAETSENCPDNTWYRFHGICYKKFESKSVDWANATKLCASHASRLANPKNQRILDFLTAYTDSFRDFWIGANDIETEGSYVWSDGTPVEFTSWRTESNYNKQPDNGKNYKEGEQNCVTTDYRGRWYDEPCEDKRRTLCEYAGN